MDTKLMVAAGVCAALVVAGAGLAMTGKTTGPKDDVEHPQLLSVDETELMGDEVADASDALNAEAVAPVKVAAAPKPDCRMVATNQTGFDPATTPYPVRGDAGNHQVLKGAAVGAAAGAVGGEVITDRAGIGAAVGAGAGAIGGQVFKKKKQKAMDEQYEAQVASYNQSKAAYDAALSTCLAA